ncbi:replication initiation factor [uncultured Nitrosomonas sp.]|uniref:replication initiation factor n=1 Tax=uncultured Nitrosomonas sp. TaxID=156424 RepID=UPI0025E63545|nr:replication initiation factor [uncultured Nitrosomonas sp.]
MSQETKESIQSAEPTCDATRESAAAWRDGEVEQDLTGALHLSESSSEGTPPSNTVPNNCNNEYFKLLRFGVDSLYLSYPGELFPDVDERLTELKQIAQSPEPFEQVKAQYPINSHIFEVKDKGARLFPYILEDNAFRIQLSRSQSVPLAYVKLSSEYLTHVGSVAAEKELQSILAQFGVVYESANVSRIDLFVDFFSSVDMESWDRHAWVTRASSINNYSIERAFSGWVIGAGGVISCRLYDKTLEIEKQSKKFYLHELWKKAGWNGEDKVWRLEFQLNRGVLTQKGFGKLSEVLGNLSGLWSYATTEWLRLTLPNGDDQTRSRWPIHPLWGYLSSIDWETNGGPLSSRFSAARVPGNDWLCKIGLSTLISLMACKGIKDFDSGIRVFKDALYVYHERKSFYLGLTFDDYIQEKVTIKARQFNTILNRSIEAEEQASIDKDAAEYRKQSDGE